MVLWLESGKISLGCLGRKVQILYVGLVVCIGEFYVLAALSKFVALY